MCDVLALYFRREDQDYQGSHYCTVQHSNFVLLNSVDSLTFSVKVILLLIEVSNGRRPYFMDF